MADSRRVVDEIRFFLQSTDQTKSDQLAELATAYAEACVEVNQRLRRCGEFLRQGLRSEAIHLAEAEPNLLDSVATLDMPERGQWDEVVSGYDLARPPVLLVELAEALNEAYAEEQPLEGLLRRHRLLALARAPLSLRLSTMRKLARLDPNNSFWEDDVRGFEKVRFDELDAAAKKAFRNEDLARLSALEDELQGTAWVEPPPRSLTQGISDGKARLVRSQARRWLGDTCVELNDALAAFDVDRGRKLRKRWQQLADAAELDGHDLLLDRGREALEWLAEEDRREAAEREYDAAIQSLGAALDDDLAGPEFERLAHAVLKHDRGMPEALHRRLQSRLHALELDATRRYRLIVASAVTGVLLVAVVVVLVVRGQVRRGEITEHYGIITALLEEQRFEEAAKYFATLDERRASIAHSSQLEELRHRLDRLLEEDSVRAKLFARGMADATAGMQKARTMLEGMDSVSTFAEKSLAQLSLDATLAAVAGDLQRCLNRARLPSEKISVEEAMAALDQSTSDAQVSRDNHFTTAVTALSGKVANLEVMSVQSAEAKSLLRECEYERSTLAQFAETVTPSLKPALDGLSTRIDNYDERTRERARQVERERSLTDNVGDINAYAATLQRYAEEFPKAVMSPGIKRALDERATWEAVVAWNRLALRWARSRTDIDRDTARERLKECRDFLESHPRSPESEVLRQYSDFLGALASRDDALVTPIRSLFLSDPRIHDLWMVQAKIGAYYCNERPTVGETVMGVRFLVDPNAPDQSKRERGDILRRGNLIYVGHAPQSIIAREAVTILDATSDDSWDKAWLDVAELVLDGDRTDEDAILGETASLDPVLQMYLLDVVLTSAASGSHPLSLALRSHRAFIEKAKDAGVDFNVRWMDPTDRAGDEVRKLARSEMKRFPPLAEARQEVQRYMGYLREGLGLIHEWKGWLGRNHDGSWECKWDAPPAGTHDLFIVIPGPEGRASWFQIGRFSDGSVELSKETDAFLDGRPVFVKLSIRPQ